MLWCVVTWTLSSRSDPADLVGGFKLNDKLSHGLAWAAGAFFAAWAAASPVRRIRGLVAALLFCGLWGVLDEVHQSFVPGRESSGADLAADLAGALLGALLFDRALESRRRRTAETMNSVA